ncbi:15637_t:CDS:2, partial [Gigaspora rosea]
RRENLRPQSEVNEEAAPYDMEVTHTKKPRRKRELSMIDKLCPYDVAEDIMNAPANITIRQLLQYANQRSNSAKALRRPLLPAQEAAMAQARIYFDEQKLILKHQGQTIEVPISHTGMDILTQEQEEWDRESKDTFDEFTYENKELDEKEGYCILESEEELDIYDNPWVNEVSHAIYQMLVEEVPTRKEEVTELTLAKRESHLFDVKPEKLGTTSLVTHRIDTAEARQIRQHFYRTSPDEQEFLDRECKLVLELIFEERLLGGTNEPKDQEKTAFRLMDKVLSEYIRKFVAVYIDDVNIYSKSFQEHLNHLKKVLEKLNTAGLKINLEKCKIFKTEIHFLGHIVGLERIRHDEEKIEKTFYLHMDALGTGLGAVLVQKNEENKEHMIAYTSRGLSCAEKNYSATVLECLAVLWSVEYYHHYFGFKLFVVVTDHIALKWLHTAKLNVHRARWIIRLQPYNYTIQHRAGKVHGDADALSRQTEDKDREIDQPKKLEKENEGTLSNTAEEKEWLLSLADLVDEGRKDQLLESGNANVYGDEDLESGKETTEEYYQWMKELNQKFECVLTWSENEVVEKTWWSDSEALDTPSLDDLYSVESPMWGESATGVEFSDSKSDWGGEGNKYEVFMVEKENQCEDFMMQKEEGGPEEPYLRPYSKNSMSTEVGRPAMK